MCDTTFSFGQRGSHFFQCPTQTDHIRLPTKLAKFLASSQLEQIHHVCLGFQDSFLLTWRDIAGQDHVESSGLPQELTNFLYARNSQRLLVRDVPNVRCALGPYNSSFLVHDKAACLWMNLPENLLAALQSRISAGSWIDHPRIVALGAGNSFVLLTENHAAVWDLENYKNASKFLENSSTQQGGISAIHNIALHSYRFQSFIAQSGNGTLLYENLPPHGLSGVQSMIGPVAQDSTEVERRPLSRSVSERQEALPRRLSALQQRAQLRREWSNHSQEITKHTRALKISLSLSVNLGGLARVLG